ncbi:uncharacterized protein MYCGRDRAFT_92255 [Zymoseptoria tritici IPO323]|uniref:N-acetyltransferase domain-containing protein n=1 Tax=Zymoseptoria tritici (strain CBS 115943 / IPO323) TaxID=336722 RepID=F9X9Y8_ZYMTI|nr:uncharacterized protein MYCGRDRAFT_92255 [Zymoseptoria tritici IPO323]EGP87783.1 hypothetical protein MYCGRDRAFT_92255 [Zymoseptoria tritici IPO323]
MPRVHTSDRVHLNSRNYIYPARPPSTEQWGAIPSRVATPNVSDRTKKWIELSEQNAPFTSGSEEWCRVFIAETKSSPPVAVAALVLEAKAAGYVHEILPAQTEDDPFVYLTYLITNRDAGAEERKGGGEKMIELAREEGRKAGVGRICVDCWRGNGRKLVRYYESQGFKALGDFTVPKPGTEEGWEGTVLEMRL